MRHSPLTEFALLARAPDEALDLERLSSCIARIGTPALDAAALGGTLDRLAEQVADDVHPGSPPDELVAALARTIGGRLGFRGTPDVFNGPEGSFLDKVVERRTGLPILLAVVWILLGKRLGVPIVGIGYPGHFLVGLELPGARLYVDPFAGGEPREAVDLLARLPPGAGRNLLDPSPTRAILTRVLTNLKHLWVGAGAHEAALGAVDRLLLLGGEVPGELRDRGLLALRLARTTEGRRDLERYLAIAADAPDRADVERILGRGTGR
ncbi:MAG: transglutaminase-like domain-containing protein [Pseudomonadota bacterium]|nr:transglutaminase-like domain-containing protein [Pseudomonadota bacterium]